MASVLKSKALLCLFFAMSSRDIYQQFLTFSSGRFNLKSSIETNQTVCYSSPCYKGFCYHYQLKKEKGEILTENVFSNPS